VRFKNAGYFDIFSRNFLDIRTHAASPGAVQNPLASVLRASGKAPILTPVPGVIWGCKREWESTRVCTR
jgi:hypothetical protein